MHFGRQGRPMQLPGDFQKDFLHDSNKIREQIPQSGCKENKTKPKRTFKQDDEKQAAGATDGNSFHTEAGWHALA